jgi:hypothetical protein
MNIKDSIRNNVVFPTVEGGETAFQQIALVLSTNESNSTCKIQYRDKKNKKRTKRNVPVQLNSGGLIDWFPEKDDYVTIDITAGEPVIVGEPRFASVTSNTSKNTLESDVYSDNVSGETSGGYIY